MQLFIQHLYNKKITNLIMYYQNIYVNNHKFLLIVVIVLQLFPGPLDSIDRSRKW